MPSSRVAAEPAGAVARPARPTGPSSAGRTAGNGRTLRSRPCLCVVRERDAVAIRPHAKVVARTPGAKPRHVVCAPGRRDSAPVVMLGTDLSLAAASLACCIGEALPNAWAAGRLVGVQYLR